MAHQQVTLHVENTQMKEVRKVEQLLSNSVQTVGGVWKCMELQRQINDFRPNLDTAPPKTRELWERITTNNLKALTYGNNLFKLLRKAMIKLELVYSIADGAGRRICNLDPSKMGANAIKAIKAEIARVNQAIDEVEAVANEIAALTENPFGEVKEDSKHFLEEFFKELVGSKNITAQYDSIAENMTKLAENEKKLSTLYNGYYDELAELIALQSNSKYTGMQISSGKDQLQILEESIKALQLRQQLIQERSEKERAALKKQEQEQKEKLERMRAEAIVKNDERKERIRAEKQASLQQQQQILQAMQNELNSIGR
jgi:hypothetical protein